MHLTKILAAGTASLLVSLSLTFPISAHGCHKQVKASYPVCTIEDCTETGCHLHDGEYYCGQAKAGYPVCTVEDCTETGCHLHDGEYYCGQAKAGYPVCTIEDCTETGRHLHDGEYYCGYDHESGYCDGSCTAATTKTNSATTRRHGRGHHGCH